MILFLKNIVLLGSLLMCVVIITLNLGVITGIHSSDTYKQLQFLKAKRNKGEAQKMQDLFPEGFMFYDTLYGLTWADFLKNQKVLAIEKEGKDELDKVLKSILSEKAKSTFQKDLELSHGAFYRSWSTYFLGKMLIITPNDSSIIDTFQSNCTAISEALKSSKSPFLESYKNQCWPADIVVGIAAISLHDQLFEPKYEDLIAQWLQKVKAKLDKNGLIPHSVDIAGDVVENARGSSQSLILSFLPIIDPVFSKTQYERFKTLFVEKRLGLNAIREYPIGTVGYGDIDSGPVIWDIGTAATLVAQKASSMNNDFELYSDLLRGIESFGFSYSNSNQKMFLAGVFPIGDAFIAWTRADSKMKLATEKQFWTFHFISLIAFIFLFLTIMVLTKKLAK